MPIKYRFSFKVLPDKGDTYPNNFKCWVFVTDAKDPNNWRCYYRRGYGKYIGNFSPIWITIDGVKKQLTEWARVEI